jgi:hypothetical protein
MCKPDPGIFFLKYTNLTEGIHEQINDLKALSSATQAL